MNDKIIFYGGSFDPIHNGHVALARSLNDKMNAKVIVIPVINWMKPAGLLTLPERIEVTKKALEYEKNVEVVDWAMHWDKMESTYEFVRQYKEKHPECKAELYIAMGADALEKLPYWDQVEKLVPLVKLLVVYRPGYGLDLTSAADLGFKVEMTEGVGAISSSDIRNKKINWRTYVPGNVWHLVKDKLDK